jgi:hypothetical protein
MAGMVFISFERETEERLTSSVHVFDVYPDILLVSLICS